VGCPKLQALAIACSNEALCEASEVGSFENVGLANPVSPIEDVDTGIKRERQGCMAAEVLKMQREYFQFCLTTL
jgi:hypothetical protein